MDNGLRLSLYRTMVLIRVFEEAILREYHADKRPAFDIPTRRGRSQCE